MPTDERLQRFEELRFQSQVQLLNFVNNEIQLGFTFVQFAAAERELGNLEHYLHSKQDADKAVVTIRHFLPSIVDGDARRAAAERCSELEAAAASL